ncbi:MAG: hypothetical protein K6G09_10135 [Treponema sp.]|nr:hypothetical protein [Treponema sp.]
MRKILLLFLLLAGLGFARETDLASVKIVDQDHFSKMMNDLKSLQKEDNGNNSDFQRLIDKASEVAEMYDRCSSINLSDVLDTSCVHFFNVDFPAFEKIYFETTGEMRISSVKVTNDLEERRMQLSKCSQFLFDNMLEAEAFLTLRGRKWNVEPIDDYAVEVSFAFDFVFDNSRAQQLNTFANAWADKCEEIIMTEGGKSFAPYFVNKIDEQNTKNLIDGKNLRITLDQDLLRINVSMESPANIVYEVNGTPIFKREMFSDDPYFYVNMRELTGRVVDRDLEVDGIDSTAKFGSWPKKAVGNWRWLRSNQEEAENYAGSEPIKPYVEKLEPLDVSYDDDDNEISTEIDQEEGSSNKLFIGGVAAGVASLISFGVGAYFHSQALDKADAKPASAAEYNKNRDDIKGFQNSRNVAYVVGALSLLLSGTLIVLSF